MKNMLILSCLVVTAWANHAMAAKPLPMVKLSAGPFIVLQSCRITNYTNDIVPIQFELCIAKDDNTSPPICDDISSGGNGTIMPGNWAPELLGRALPDYSYNCVLGFEGDKGDIGGIACGSISDTQIACVPLQ